MRKHTLWTGARIKRLRELAPLGIGAKAIADTLNKEFGTSYTPSAVQRRTYRSGIAIARIPAKPRKRALGPRSWTAEEDRIARSMLAAGASPVMVSIEILEVTGKFRTDVAVFNRADKKGWQRKKKFRAWTPREDDEMRRLLASGLDQQGVADAMGISKTRVKHRMGRLRLTAARMPEWPEVRRQKLASLVRSGLSAAEIGAAMGVSKSTVIGQCKRRGYKLAFPPGHRTYRTVKGVTHGVSP